MTTRDPRPALRPVHELARMFPKIAADQKREFFESIARDGVRRPIVLFDDSSLAPILDGVNRYEAACAAGIPETEIPFRIFGSEEGDGDDPLEFVMRENFLRRQLNASQRAMVAADIESFKHGGNRKSSEAQGDGQDANLHLDLGTTRAEAAEKTGVSVRSVASAAEIKAKGSGELQEAVRDGRIKLASAAELAELSHEEQREIVAKGPKEILAKAKEIRATNMQERRKAAIDNIKRITEGNTPLPTGEKVPVLYLDPPTRFESGFTDRSIENHYPTMDFDQLAVLPIDDLAADDCVMFCWTTIPWLANTIKLAEEHWGGFEYKSCYAWDKEVAGTGYWARNQHELLLVFTRGKIPSPPRSALYPSIERSKKREHSRKPDFYFRMIAEYYPELRKMVLFHRGAAPHGWEAWGNEVETADDGVDVIDKLKAPEPKQQTLAEAALAAIEKDKCKKGCSPAPTGVEAIDACFPASKQDDLDIPDFLRRTPEAVA